MMPKTLCGRGPGWTGLAPSVHGRFLGPSRMGVPHPHQEMGGYPAHPSSAGRSSRALQTPTPFRQHTHTLKGISCYLPRWGVGVSGRRNSRFGASKAGLMGTRCPQRSVVAETRGMPAERRAIRMARQTALSRRALPPLQRGAPKIFGFHCPMMRFWRFLPTRWWSPRAWRTWALCALEARNLRGVLSGGSHQLAGHSLTSETNALLRTLAARSRRPS